MSVKTTVAEFNTFIGDDDHWDAKGYEHYDETLFEVNGREVEEYDPEAHAQDVVVKIIGGTIVYNDKHDGKVVDLTKAFRAWRKEQGTRQLLISVPNDVSDSDIRKAIKVLGGRLL